MINTPTHEIEDWLAAQLKVTLARQSVQVRPAPTGAVETRY
jgi:hypothetical protein